VRTADIFGERTEIDGDTRGRRSDKERNRLRESGVESRLGI
jgi:hypothetical protein